MMEARRERYERRGASVRPRGGTQITQPSEPWAELHTEIARLPEKYRIPIVLCYFEGLTHDQAAGRLGWPVGTVKTRLARGREQLRRRLDHRGWNTVFIFSTEHLRTWEAVGIHRLLLESTARAAAGFVSGAGAGGFISSSVLSIAHGVLKGMLIQHIRLAAITLFGVAALGVGATVAARQAPEKGQINAQLAPAVTLTDEAGLPTVLKLTGTTDYVPDAVVQVHAPCDSRVDKVYVALGANVRKGDPLLELFSADLAEAKSDYEAAISLWDRDKKTLDFKSPLAKENTLPRKELIEAESAEAQSRLKTKLAKDKLSTYGLTEAEIEEVKHQAGAQKAKMILRSPSDGVVIRRAVSAGVFYTPANALLVIAKVDTILVRARVERRYAETLGIGQQINLDAPGLKAARARVEAISWDGAPETGKVLIQTSLGNPDHRLMAGMEVRLGVELKPGTRSTGVNNVPIQPKPILDLEEQLTEAKQKLRRLLEEKDGRTPGEEILRQMLLIDSEPKTDRAPGVTNGK